MQFELDGAAKIEFEKTGLHCTITVPLRPDVAAFSLASGGS
jgi:hypothetical protein